MAVLVADRSSRDKAVVAGRKDPAAWAEILALTVGQLQADQADSLVRQIADAGVGGHPLLYRVIADAEWLAPETINAALCLGAGRSELDYRRSTIEAIPRCIKDRVSEVRLLDRIRQGTTNGNDLYWIHHELSKIIDDLSIESGLRHDAALARCRLFDHIPTERLLKVWRLMAPWLRMVPPAGQPLGPYQLGNLERGSSDQSFDFTLASSITMLGVPVTWEMYQCFDPGHNSAQVSFPSLPTGRPQAHVPVYNVTWFAATMFATWLSRLWPDGGARLPMEAEWELACRCGTVSRYWFGDDEAGLSHVDWYRDNSSERPHCVAELPANPWGLHDMHGNVHEWCADVYNSRDQQPLRLSSMTGSTFDPADSGVSCRVRGGSWRSHATLARSAARNGVRPSLEDDVLGFRLVLPGTIPQI